MPTGAPSDGQGGPPADSKERRRGPNRDAILLADRIRSGFRGGSRRVRERAQSAGGAEGGASEDRKVAEAPDLKTVYFDLDRADIRSDARRALKSNASEIMGNGSWRKVVLEGHCDERGSEEYNMALGERRSDAVKRYLMDLGLPGSKIVTVSYGEDRPGVRGRGESAWQANRRVEFAFVN